MTGERFRELCQFYATQVTGDGPELIAEVRRCREVLDDAKDLIKHAIATEHFTPGGSTEGWAIEILGAIDDLEKKP